MTLLPPTPRTAVVTAAGTAEIDFTLPVGGIVHQVSVSMASAPTNATCSLLFNGNLITPLVPTADAAGGDPPVPITGQDTLSVVWTNCTPKVIATAVFIYDDGT
jgi:hypothetical protein